MTITWFIIIALLKYLQYEGPTILSNLEKSINDEGTLVTKEYVKGRGNLYANPAISEYNRTTDSANKTVTTLLRILKEFDARENSSAEDEDPLMKIINGGGSV